MPLFGEKPFEENESEEIKTALSRSLSVAGTSSGGKSKDSANDCHQMINMANDIFGFNGWSHSVTQQSIDFVDCDGGKYDAGVSALVKVMLKDGVFHEDVGYGVIKGIKCKGTAISKARKMAANDGLKNALGAFGQCFMSINPTGKITDFFASPNVKSTAAVTSTATKRKSAENMNDCAGVSKSTKVSSSRPSSSTTSSAQRKLFFDNAASDNVTQRTQSDDTLFSNHLSSELSNTGNCKLISADGRRFSDEDTWNTSSQVIPPPSNISPADKGKLHRKFRQLQLEVEAREKHMDWLKTQLNNGDDEGFFPLETILTEIS